jgi:hypothetical protein
LNRQGAKDAKKYMSERMSDLGVLGALAVYFD